VRKSLAEVPADHTIKAVQEGGRTTLQIFSPDGALVKEVVILAPQSERRHWYLDEDDDD